MDIGSIHRHFNVSVLNICISSGKTVFDDFPTSERVGLKQPCCFGKSVLYFCIFGNNASGKGAYLCSRENKTPAI